MNIPYRFGVLTLCAFVLTNAGTASADDDSDNKRNALLAAAAIAGVAALAHHHQNHDDGEHYDSVDREAEYERGYRDGLHHAGFNNFNNSSAYSQGFDAGNHDRNVQVSHNRHNEWDSGRHGSPAEARQACIREAAGSLNVRPDQVTATSSREHKDGRHDVIVSAGYHRMQCEVDNRGQIRSLKDLPLDTHWGHHGGHGRDGHSYSTNDHDATARLACSWGRPDHNKLCDVGIDRGNNGAATLHIHAPNGSQRILNFSGQGRDISTNGGRLTWGKQGDDWYIGIDNREFYIVPEAAVFGG